MKLHYANDHGLSVTITETDIMRVRQRPGHAWPCATINRAFSVQLEHNGDLVHLSGPDMDHADAHELAALVSDVLADCAEQTWRSKTVRDWLTHYAETQSERV